MYVNTYAIATYAVVSPNSHAAFERRSNFGHPPWNGLRAFVDRPLRRLPLDYEHVAGRLNHAQRACYAIWRRRRLGEALHAWRLTAGITCIQQLSKLREAHDPNVPSSKILGYCPFGYSWAFQHVLEFLSTTSVLGYSGLYGPSAVPFSFERKKDLGPQITSCTKIVRQTHIGHAGLGASSHSLKLRDEVL